MRRLAVSLAVALLLGLLALLFLSLGRAQQGPLAVGSRMPDFELTTFNGQTWRTAELRGHVLVVNFWASWCQPCEEEAVLLEQVHREVREEGVIFLGVNYADTEPEALTYLEGVGATYPNGPDLGTRIAQAFRIRGVPETYVINGEGVVTARKIGPYTDPAELLAAIERSLEAGG